MYRMIIVILLLMVSCQDILQETPKSVVEETFYNTPGELETAVNAIFPPIRAYNAFGFLYPAQLESYSDIIKGRGSYDTLNNMRGLDNTNVTRIGSMWDQFYLGIRNANIVIKNAPNANDTSTDLINHYIAEAKFMRAFIYFHMIQNFGKVVLRTEDNMEELHVPLSNSETVYSQIVEDLSFAELHLPDNPSVSGRPTLWAAKAVLAHVHFVLGNYSNTMELTRDIIDSGKFNLLQVRNPDDFQDLYGPTVDSTQEEIFYLKYNRESGWSYVEFLHHPSSPYYNGAGLFAQYVDTTLYLQWEDWNNNDLRKNLFYSWDFGLGPHTMLNKKFIDMDRTESGGNDYPFYRYADILLMYSESNVRANGSITNDALNAINMVRRRAYGKDIFQESEFDYQLDSFNNHNDFIDVIIMERGFETYLEGGKRWLDLKRLGREKTKEIYRTNLQIDVDDRHFLWPIPESEIELNNAIDQSDQNPGY